MSSTRTISDVGGGSGDEAVASRAAAAMMANPKFQQLTKARSSLGWTLAAVVWIIYFGFILLVAFNKTDGQILSGKVGGGTTSWAIVVGFAILIATFVITAIYVTIANSRFDRLANELRAEAGR